jgi:protein N-terminal asparagine amidohydrolase
MVIANSDSTGTLVSLGNGLKRVASYQGFDLGSYNEVVTYQPTDLLLPEDTFLDDSEIGLDGSFHSCSLQVDQQLQQQKQPLYLPKKRDAVDQCLRSNMIVMERCDQLLAQTPVVYNDHSKERVLYVAQGEVAYAVPLHCDVLVSDKATTCHIIAMQSCSDHCTPMSSLTHIDSAAYEESVRAMLQDHKTHHRATSVANMDADAMSDSRIALAIHIVGGFEDDKGSSREISNWLISLLACIASEEKDSLKITLETVAVSCMNDDGHCAPIGRGLAINVKTGETFLARCETQVAGPCMSLRSARLWSGIKPKLHLIHTAHSNACCIEPFSYTPFKEIDALLRLQDHVLLRYTSTSPECEEDDFCHSLRSTLTFLRDTPCKQTFGDRLDQPLVYRRIRQSNTWQLSC